MVYKCYKVYLLGVIWFKDYKGKGLEVTRVYKGNGGKGLVV